MKKLVLLLAGLSSAAFLSAQNVGIGTASPNTSAKLEILDANRGILLPRVALTSTTVAAPVSSPANWLIVFNTNNINDVSEGLYYWNGTRWVRLSTSNDWTILGNAGTNPNTNFVGTTDAQDLVFRTGNTEKMRLLNNGRLSVSTTTPRGRIHAEERFINNIGTIYPLLPGVTVQDNSDFIGFSTVDKDGNAGTIDDSNMLIYWGDNGDEHLYFSHFAYVGGATQMTRTDLMTIQGNGNVGIGVISPTNKLQVAGNTSTTNFQMTNAAINGGLMRSDATGNGSWATAASVITPVAWSLTGNAGTNASTNFVGTTDAVDFVARTNNAERMRVLANGSLVDFTLSRGLNVRSANTNADILKTGYIEFFDNTGDQSWFIGDGTFASNALQIVQNTANEHITLWTNPTGGASAQERMRVTDAGNVGIGTTTPARKLDVFGGNVGVTSNADVTDISIINSNTTGSANAAATLTFVNQNSNRWIQYLGGPNSGYSGVQPNAMEWWYYPSSAANGCCHQRFAIRETTAGYVPVVINGTGQMFGNGWAQPSDKNLKENISRIDNPIAKVKQLGGYTYQFTEASGLNDNKTHVGVLAQEVEAVLPQAISQFPDKDFKAVDYDAITPLLIEAIKAQQVQIEQLQKEIEQLKNK